MKVSKIQKHFDKVAEDYDYYKIKNSFYYDNLKKLLKRLILPNKNVLEIGCGTGDLLATLNPKKGYGYDLSRNMINLAQHKHKRNKKIIFSSRTEFIMHRSLDYIFMSDVIEHLENPKAVFDLISKRMKPSTQFVCTMANPLWEPILMFWEKMGWKMPEGPHKRIRYKDIKILCDKVELKIIKHDFKLLVPIKLPFITEFANNYLEKYLRHLCFIEYFVAIKA